MLTLMGCIPSKNQESNRNHDEEDSEFELQPKNEEEKKLFLDLNSKERALIKDTWKSFRGEHDCRFRILMTFISRNPGMKGKFQAMINKNKLKADYPCCQPGTYDQLIDAMVSWNLRRFSIRFVEFLDRLVRDAVESNFRDIYEICEAQGFRHWRLSRNVEPGTMEALATSVQVDLANYHGPKKFTRLTAAAWQKLFDVVTLRFYRGHERAKEEAVEQTQAEETRELGMDFPVEEFLNDVENAQKRRS